jgi:predicted phage terminase large subunit-like protein
MEKLRRSFAPPLTTFAITRDSVIEVVDSGRAEVFDIEVARTGNFIANGLVSHNTRWHEDDLIGRLTDPLNPNYSDREARQWRVIDMPALARKKDVLGRQVGEALWPERFDRNYLENIRQTDLRGFTALYQGRPTPEEGSFFKAVQLRTYARVSDMPPKERLRFYAASDHAVSLEQGRDKTCILVVGVDDHDQLWLQPDCFWKQADTSTVVETMIVYMERYKPLFWWAEKGHISKSIGPFLRKRMLEKRVFCSIDEINPVADKQTRAQSIQGRMAMLRVLFPAFTRWWPEASDQLLKFPHGTHDDFVDALALFGAGLYKQKAQRLPPKKDEMPTELTYGWVIESSEREQKRRRESKTIGGW